MKRIWICIVLALVLVGCEDFLKKEIEIDMADSTPKVTVTATLENGVFYIFLGLSNPITSLPASPSGNVERALIKLYEDGREILTITEPSKIDESDIPFYFSYYPDENWVYPFFAYQEGVSFVPGKTYRLEVTVDGYPPVSSTVVAPDEVQVPYASMKRTPMVERDPSKVGCITEGEGFIGGCDRYYQISININDNPHTKDYYMIEVWELSENNLSQLDVATSDRALVRDNPDIMANQWLDDTDVNTYSFRQMILSDLTFGGGNNTLNLLLSSCSIYSPLNRSAFFVSVRHLNRESYHYYRTFALQQISLDFFSEPVSLISNIDGGYGCFAVCTRTIALLQ